MTFNPRDPAALEAFLRERIREKTETDKLDFKRDLKFSERRERLEMVKDINALVNTFGLEYDDHGFLIFGMNREDGQVSHPVTVLDTLGTDKLEAQIAELVHGNMQPAPAFNLYSFQEPDVGTWGAIVIWPNQPPPFVFSKEGAYQGDNGKKVLWTTGDWFMRRGARTVRPEPLDYAHMIQVRVQGAVAPLNARIEGLEYQLAHIQGQVTALQADSHAAVTGELLRQGQVVEAVTFTTPDTAGQELIEPQRAEFERAIAEIRLGRRTKEAPLGGAFQTQYGEWMSQVQTFDAAITPAERHPHHKEYRLARQFLTTWALHGDEEDRAFPRAGYYRNQRDQRMHHHVLLGADAGRAQAYLQLLTLARSLHEDVSKAAACAPFEEFTLRLSNPSKKATGTLRVTITCTGGGQLHRFAPQDRSRSSNAEFPGYSPDHVVPLEAVEEERGELLPGETWTTRRFAVKFEQEGTLNLHVRILAQHLPEGQELEFQCAVTAR